MNNPATNGLEARANYGFRVPALEISDEVYRAFMSSYLELTGSTISKGEITENKLREDAKRIRISYSDLLFKLAEGASDSLKRPPVYNTSTLSRILKGLQLSISDTKASDERFPDPDDETDM